jgi:DNA mismatch repair ATPase MutS
VERRRFVAAPLAAMGERFKAAGDRPSRGMVRLERVVESLAIRHGALMYAVVSSLLLWELWWCFRLEGWRAAFGKRVRGDLAALADFEALASMAALAHDHPHFSWPEVYAVAGERPVIEGRGLAYPLFRPERRVANDFSLARGGQLVLITGSNMSGKSSFLRALGANAILAQAGAPVCAAALRLQACRLATSIQVTDAPDQGLSRFYAEVQRIRRILDALDAAEADPSRPPCLYLVDEMLSGTNSRERNQASRAIVAHLLGAGRSFGLVTTHDLELVEVSADRERVPLYHFSDRFDGAALHFDYTLRPGRATTTNALHVLRLAGIAVPETSAASAASAASATSAASAASAEVGGGATGPQTLQTDPSESERG